MQAAPTGGAAPLPTQVERASALAVTTQPRWRYRLGPDGRMTNVRLASNQVTHWWFVASRAVSNKDR
jgi:hypothetical protein